MKLVDAVVILYNPNLDILLNNVQVLSKQVRTVYLIDNSSVNLLTTGFTFSNNIHYHFNGDNLGIAEAQNIGILLAKEQGADYITLFDQDSDVTDNFIDGLLSSFDIAAKHNIKLACVGPRVVDIFTDSEVKPLIQKEGVKIQGLTLCSQIIASGKMIDINVLNQIGMMESQLFIDGVDHEWCWRAKKYGYATAINEKVKMVHQLGEARKRFLGIPYKVSSSIRLYYQFRNILILSRRNYVPVYWKVRNLLAIPVRYVILSLVDKRSTNIQSYMHKGILDGLKKRYGKYK